MNNKSVIETARIGLNTVISDFCVIRENVKIGNNVVIHPHVTIYDGVEIGDNVEIFSGVVIGKEPKAPNVLSREIEFRRRVNIGKHTILGANSIIYCDVVIGDNCLIGDNVAVREKCHIENSCILGMNVTLNYNVRVGRSTVIMAKSHITGNTRIGNNVFISVGVTMANDNNFGMKGYNEETISGPFISDYSKIGVGAVILPSVRIGKNALVSAGSVVTRNVAPNSQVMGVPARHIKYLLPVEKSRMFLV